MSSIIKIDEEKLNYAMKSVCYDSFKKIVSKKKIYPIKESKKIKRKISPAVTKIISELKLEDEPNYEERMKSFTNHCRNFSKNTVKKYYNEAKSLGIFGDNSFIPDYNQFVGKQHTRIVEPKDFIKFISFLKQNFNEYNAPLLVAYYTGLRNKEILKLSLFSLYQLSNRLTFVHIKRKNTKSQINQEGESDIDDSLIKYWKPVYNSELCKFIDDLINLYKNEYEEFLINKKLNMFLFYITPTTLIERQKSQYYKATQKLLPYGFGIHGYRTEMASILSLHTPNLPAIQQFLQHENINTTILYVKQRFEYIRNEFDRLTKTEFSKIASSLLNPEKPLETQKVG